jgi:quinol monooxygenase YgiN
MRRRPIVGQTVMILEIAEFFIEPGTQEEFGRAVERGVATIIAASPGFLRYELQRGIENPQRWVLLIEWERLESHTVDFRGSSAFVQWRAAVAPYFARPPQVEHFHRHGGTRAAD